MKRVTAIIPCYNEAEGIGEVIDSFPRARLKKHGYCLDVLVVDNNSSDGTAEVARRHGARVIFEPKQGKGNAIRTAFANIGSETDYVVMLDGDYTYRPQEIVRLLEPLSSDFCDVVIGSRLGGRISEGSMKGVNLLGNWIYSHLVRYTYKVKVSDVLTGYFAWRREVIQKLHPHLRSDGFAIEMEMITKMARLGYEIFSVPISYDARAGASSLNPVRDGLRILRMYGKNLAWKPISDSFESPTLFDKGRSLEIAIVSDAVYPYNKGGKEVRLDQLSNRLARMGHNVTIYTMKWWEGPNEITHRNVTFKAIAPLMPLYAGERRSIKQGVLFSLYCFKLLFARFDVVDVDHMPFFPLYTMRFVCFLRGRKMFATWHEVWGKEYWREYLGSLSGSIAWAIEKWSVKLPSHIFAVSEMTAVSLREVLGYQKSITVIPNGIEARSISSVKPAALRSDIIFAGRLLKHKHVDLLLRAVKLLVADDPNLRCVIIGDGPEYAPLVEQARRLRIDQQVVFTGFLPTQTQVFAHIKSSKVFALPSTREGFGISVLEANACGLPVVTIDHPANAARELIVEGENGRLSKLSARDLAKQLRAELTNPSNAKAVSGLARSYDWQKAAKKSNEALLYETA